MDLKRVSDWGRKGYTKRLHKALRSDKYNIRVEAIRQIKHLKNPKSIDELQVLVNDPFLVVLEEAYDALKILKAEPQILLLFESKIDSVKKYDQKRSQKTSQSFIPKSPDEEREVLEKMAQDYDILKIYQEGLKEEKREIFNWRIAGFIVGLVALTLYAVYAIYYS